MAPDNKSRSVDDVERQRQIDWVVSESQQKNVEIERLTRERDEATRRHEELTGMIASVRTDAAELQHKLLLWHGTAQEIERLLAKERDEARNERDAAQDLVRTLRLELVRLKGEVLDYASLGHSCLKLAEDTEILSRQFTVKP